MKPTSRVVIVSVPDFIIPSHYMWPFWFVAVLDVIRGGRGCVPQAIAILRLFSCTSTSHSINVYIFLGSI